MSVQPEGVQRTMRDEVGELTINDFLPLHRNLAEYANCADHIFINPRRESQVIFRLVVRVRGADPLDVLDHSAS